jgi:Na+-translocating ferredoxin:NAD+ oxidoreductase RNF subunit RnfB
MTVVLLTAAFALVLAFVLGTVLGFFKEYFAVPVDPLVENIRGVLPGANCGACGFPGCDNYAAAIARGEAGISACTVGGSAVVEKLAAITGGEGRAAEQTVAVLACQGSFLHAPQKGTYTGIATCRGAKIAAGGTKLCSWGCLGFGDCVPACKFNALGFNREKGLPVIDYAKCTGCGMCANECPQGVIKNVPKDLKGAMVFCSNVNPNRQQTVKSCKIACIKCGLCVKQCPQQCIDLSTNIPVVDSEKCDSCGLCAEKCPAKVLKIIEKEIVKQQTA